MNRKVLLAVLLAAVSSSAAQSKASPETAKSFVQDFYTWYVAKAVNHPGNPGADYAIKQRRSSFSPALTRALEADYAASAKSPDEIVGLDFDPFLNTQDPCERYEVGETTRVGSGYRVEVYAVCFGKREAHAYVSAEVQGTSGSWQFTNFHYTDEHGKKSNLLGVLASLRRERTHH